MKYLNIFSFVLCTLCASFLYAKPQADLIITNGYVWTVEPGTPTAEALAIIGERIVAVGSAKEIDDWKGSHTKVIDAKKNMVLPGFDDAHVHFVTGGANLDNIDLKNTKSPQQFASIIGDRARVTKSGQWILGGNWDDQKWDPAKLPTKELIDSLTKDIPVFVSRYDGHMALANSMALRLAGVTRKTQNPPGGQIVRDAAGNPTGILKDAAMNYVYKIIPPMSHDRRLEVIRNAMRLAASFGVTSVQDMNPEYEDVAAYAELQEKGELTVRIYAAPMETHYEDQVKIGLRHAFGTSFLRLGAVKGYADGSLGSTTAYFFDPYTDQPNTRGLLSDEMQPLSKMLERMTKADAAGLQLCIHAIGDQGISMILDMFDKVAKTNGPRDRRFRIEHAQHIAAKDFKRFVDQDVIASMQPYHAIDDGRWAEKRIGPDRIKRTYAFRTLIDDGARLAFGTDWDVAPLNPMYGIYAAVTRATLDGKNPNGWVPEQKISVAEAIEAYTLGSAYAEFEETEKGSIVAGKLADIVILDRDLFRVEGEQIRDAKVLMTIVGGKTVWPKQ